LTPPPNRRTLSAAIAKNSAAGANRVAFVEMNEPARFAQGHSGLLWHGYNVTRIGGYQA
jgi:hypothetical protein